MTKNHFSTSATYLENYISSFYKNHENVCNAFDSSPEEINIPKKQLTKYIIKYFQEKTHFHGYQPPEGYALLREKIAERYIGSRYASKYLLSCSGAQQGLHLAIEHTLNRLKRPPNIGIEYFSYIGMRHIASQIHCQQIDIGTPESPYAFPDAIKKIGRKVDLLYIIPVLQNPTGYTYRDSDIAAITKLQKIYNFAVIYDLSYIDFRFLPLKIHQYIKSLSNNGKNYIIGSFSKTISPSMRVGWIFKQNKDHFDELKALKRNNIMFTPPCIESAVYLFLVNDYEKHVTTIKKIAKIKIELLKKILNILEINVTPLNNQSQGIYLWFKINHPFDQSACEKLSLMVPSSIMFTQHTSTNNDYVRICINRSNPQEILEIALRLKQAISGKKPPRNQYSLFAAITTATIKLKRAKLLPYLN